MTSIVQIVLFACIAGEKFVNAEEADYTFRSYCNHPANFGKGEFDEKKMLCTITYNVIIKKPESAFDFCDRQHPYYLSSYEVKSSQVICKIKSHYKCESTEILIGNKCFYPRKSSKFTKEECGKRYRLHVMSSIFEQKWISAVTSSYSMMWVGNDATQLRNIQIAVHKDKVMHGVVGHVIQRNARETVAIVTSRGSKKAFPIGHLTYVTKETSLPLLCSRDADVLGSYAEAMIQKLSEVGIRSYACKDSEGKLRPFFIPRELISFERKDESSVSARRHHEIYRIFLNGYAATPFDFGDIQDFKKMLRLEKVNIVATPGQAEVKIENRNDCGEDSGYKSRRARRHHEICRIFLNGYAATPFDFDDIQDFKKMLRLEKVNIAATPGQAEVKIENRNDCGEDSGYKSRRGHNKVKFIDGSSRACGDRMWRDRYPSRTCADTP
ncbi:hypothetical protein OESDEN_02799 [Oesophagostomum dentatum]|uniref:Uncharacterized protein n=1 Tax=Oesophagostomum dentatum TaxID=61180 RepID=A0A0B1TJ11_OESDE|nr:hypothetical protein OESDEN_02799 [Oesophagostomum dentatum]